MKTTLPNDGQGQPKRMLVWSPLIRDRTPRDIMNRAFIAILQDFAETKTANLTPEQRATIFSWVCSVQIETLVSWFITKKGKQTGWNKAINLLPDLPQQAEAALVDMAKKIMGEHYDDPDMVPIGAVKHAPEDPSKVEYLALYGIPESARNDAIFKAKMAKLTEWLELKHPETKLPDPLKLLLGWDALQDGFSGSDWTGLSAFFSEGEQPEWMRQLIWPFFHEYANNIKKDKALSYPLKSPGRWAQINKLPAAHLRAYSGTPGLVAGVDGVKFVDLPAAVVQSLAAGRLAPIYARADAFTKKDKRKTSQPSKSNYPIFQRPDELLVQLTTNKNLAKQDLTDDGKAILQRKLRHRPALTNAQARLIFLIEVQPCKLARATLAELAEIYYDRPLDRLRSRDREKLIEIINSLRDYWIEFPEGKYTSGDLHGIAVPWFNQEIIIPGQATWQTLVHLGYSGELIFRMQHGDILPSLRNRYRISGRAAFALLDPSGKTATAFRIYMHAVSKWGAASGRGKSLPGSISAETIDSIGEMANAFTIPALEHIHRQPIEAETEEEKRKISGVRRSLYSQERTEIIKSIISLSCTGEVMLEIGGKIINCNGKSGTVRNIKSKLKETKDRLRLLPPEDYLNENNEQ